MHAHDRAPVREQQWARSALIIWMLSVSPLFWRTSKSCADVDLLVFDAVVNPWSHGRRSSSYHCERGRLVPVGDDHTRKATALEAREQNADETVAARDLDELSRWRRDVGAAAELGSHLCHELAGLEEFLAAARVGARQREEASQ